MKTLQTCRPQLRTTETLCKLPSLCEKSSHNPTLLVNHDGIIVKVNAAFSEAFNMTAWLLLGKELCVIFKQCTRDRRVIRDTVAQGVAWRSSVFFNQQCIVTPWIEGRQWCGYTYVLCTAKTIKV